MQVVIDIKDEYVLSDIKNRSLEAESETDKVIINALYNGTPLPDINVGDLISRQSAEEKLKKVVDEMALIFADIREKNVDDSVCGLCEYDCDHGLDGYANECPGFERNDCFKLKEEYRREWTDLSDVSPVEPERKPGKWLPVPKGNTIIISDEMADISLRLPTSLCSNCGEVVPVIGKWKRYCPMCGLKMEVSNDT